MTSLIFAILPKMEVTETKHKYIIYDANSGERKEYEELDVLVAIYKYFKDKGEDFKIVLIEPKGLKLPDNVQNIIVDKLYEVKVPSADEINKKLENGDIDIDVIENQVYLEISSIVKELREFKDIDKIYLSIVRGLNLYIAVLYDIVKRIYVREYFKRMFDNEKPQLFVISTASFNQPFYIYITPQPVYVDPFIKLYKNLDKDKTITLLENNKKLKEFFINAYLNYVLSIGYPINYIYWYKTYVLPRYKEEEILNLYSDYLGYFNNLDKETLKGIRLITLELLFAYMFALNKLNKFIDEKIELIKLKDDSEEYINLGDLSLDKDCKVNIEKISEEIKEYLKKLENIEEFRIIVTHLKTEIHRLNPCTKERGVGDLIRNFRAHRGLIYGLIDLKIYDNKLLVRFYKDREEIEENSKKVKDVLEKIKNGEIYIY